MRFSRDGGAVLARDLMTIVESMQNSCSCVLSGTDWCILFGRVSRACVLAFVRSSAL